MNAEVSFHNRYYPWTEVKADGVTCWLKGTFFHENKLLQGADVVRLFSSALEDSQFDHDSLEALLLALNGNFALALETPRYIFCTVDRVRSIPLFYAVSGDEAIFSDDANHLLDRLNTPFNEENGAEFLVTGYVTGPDTLFDGISQLQAGEYLVYDKRDGTLATRIYHRFWHGYFFSDSEEDLLDRLDEVFGRVFQRLIESTKGRQIVVPVSGGLDSRIIVAMLKRLGVEDVICFTYGKKGNREAEISRQVTEALGYRWYFVEYTKEKLYDCYHSDEMQCYLKYGGNLVSLPVIQDFLAVKELNDEGKIRENAVFVPGHSGDMLAGSWIPHDIEEMPHDLDCCIIHSLKRHYSLWRWNKTEKLGEIFQERIRKAIGNINIHDAASLSNGIEHFNFNERQAKFIVNSVRVYEFFGFQWRIPLWDAELIEFFLRAPLPHRMGQVLYVKCAAKQIFTNSLSALGIIECTTNLQGKRTAVKSGAISLIRNYLFRLFEHDLGWASQYKHPSVSRIMVVLNGMDMDPFVQCPPISHIINNNNKLRVVPSTNSLLTYDYLRHARS